MDHYIHNAQLNYKAPIYALLLDNLLHWHIQSVFLSLFLGLSVDTDVLRGYFPHGFARSGFGLIPAGEVPFRICGTNLH